MGGSYFLVRGVSCPGDRHLLRCRKVRCRYFPCKNFHWCCVGVGPFLAHLLSEGFGSMRGYGVTHVGGDMFKSIPKGDAIFMKWVLTTWTDEECQVILRNCYDALPAGGKVIACEPVVPEETDSSRRTRALLEGDIFVMTIYRSQGKERTEQEFKQLGLAAGFPSFRAIYLDLFYTVLEFQK